MLLPYIHKTDAALVEDLMYAGNHLLSDSAVAAVYGEIQVDMVLPGQEVDEVSKKDRMKLERVMK